MYLGEKHTTNESKYLGSLKYFLLPISSSCGNWAVGQGQCKHWGPGSGATTPAPSVVVSGVTLSRQLAIAEPSLKDLLLLL